MRTQRRVAQMLQQGILSTPPTPEEFARMQQEIETRDRIDSTRAASPLKPADDAIIKDTSDLTQDEVLEWLFQQCSH